MSSIYVSYLLFAIQTYITAIPRQSNYWLFCLSASLLFLKTLMWTSSLIMLSLMFMGPQLIMDLIWGWCISWLSTAVNVQKSDLRLWTSKAHNVFRYDEKWHLELPCGHVGLLEVWLVLCMWLFCQWSVRFVYLSFLYHCIFKEEETALLGLTKRWIVVHDDTNFVCNPQRRICE